MGQMTDTPMYGHEPGQDPDENWHSNSQEHVLHNLYEGAAGKFEGFKHEIFGVVPGRPNALMYVTDPDGNCWQITATPHLHARKNSND